MTQSLLTREREARGGGRTRCGKCITMQETVFSNALRQVHNYAGKSVSNALLTLNAATALAVSRAAGERGVSVAAVSLSLNNTGCDAERAGPMAVVL